MSSALQNPAFRSKLLYHTRNVSNLQTGPKHCRKEENGMQPASIVFDHMQALHIQTCNLVNVSVTMDVENDICACN